MACTMNESARIEVEPLLASWAVEFAAMYKSNSVNVGWHQSNADKIFSVSPAQSWLKSCALAPVLQPGMIVVEQATL